ncbi:MAG: ferric reductase-like transmembrane domain-containing protein [Promethearchaeia archaeon]
MATEESDKTIQKSLIVLSFVALYIGVSQSVVLNPSEEFTNSIIRLAALNGFVSLFLATALAAFTREIYQIFSRPFMAIHHVLAAIGLILITIHPVVLAITSMDASIFLPDVSSWEAFLSLGGRPALILVYVAVIAGFFRRHILNYWRIVHGLVYVALVLAYIHGIWIGTDLANPLVAGLFTIMLVISFLVLIHKRYRVWKRRK